MNEIQGDKPTTNGHGGAREGAGRPRGSLSVAKKSRLIAEQEFRDRVIRSKDALMNAQMTLAQGVQMLYVIRTEVINGKSVRQRPELVTDQATIEAYLAGDLEIGGNDHDPDEYYFITTERPDNKALDSLFDRALGKATQPIELDGNLTNRNLNSDVPATAEELDAVKSALLSAIPETGGEA